MKTGLFGGDWEDYIQPLDDHFDNLIANTQSQGAHAELARTQALDDADPMSNGDPREADFDAAQPDGLARSVMMVGQGRGPIPAWGSDNGPRNPSLVYPMTGGEWQSAKSHLSDDPLVQSLDFHPIDGKGANAGLSGGSGAEGAVLGDPNYWDIGGAYADGDKKISGADRIRPVSVNSGAASAGMDASANRLDVGAKQNALSSSDRGPHHYDFSVPLCLGCSPTDAFEAVRHFSAPGAAYAKSGTNKVILTGNNPILQTVDPDKLTIVNSALPDHEFYPGTVRLSVENVAGAVSLHIEGDGAGAHSEENQILGPVIFTTLGLAAYGMLNPNTVGP